MASRKPLLDYYEILGVPRDAGPADIAAAYKAETVRIRDLPGSGEQTRRLNLAYRALSNPERRRDYDAVLDGRSAVPVMAEEPAEPSPPFETEHKPASDEQQPRRRRGLLMGAALAAVLLLLVAGLWASSLFTDRPEVAEVRSGDEASTGSGTPSDTPQQDGPVDGLADAIASLLPGDTPPTVPPPAAPATVGAVRPPREASSARAEGSADGAPPPAAEEQAPAAAAPSEQPAAADPEPSPPPPVPAPRVDRSSGPRLLSGGLVDADNRGGRFQGTVGVRLSVGVDGRPRECRVTRSSGNAALDGTTCRLLEERLQFAPARDSDGNPTPSEVESVHVWGRQRDR